MRAAGPLSGPGGRQVGGGGVRSGGGGGVRSGGGEGVRSGGGGGVGSCGGGGDSCPVVVETGQVVVGELGVCWWWKS